MGEEDSGAKRYKCEGCKRELVARKLPSGWLMVSTEIAGADGNVHCKAFELACSQGCAWFVYRKVWPFEDSPQ